MLKLKTKILKLAHIYYRCVNTYKQSAQYFILK